MAKAGVPGWQATAGLSPQPCHSAPLGHGASPPHPYPKLGFFNKLKSGMGLEHTRHRSPINALVHIVSCLAAYTLAQPKGTIANSGYIPIPNCSSLP